MRVPVDRATPQVLTPGTGLEWTPFVTGDGQSIAFIGATAQRPPVPAVMPINGGLPRWIGLDRIPADFPTISLVVPRKVVFKSSDGMTIHGQLFEKAGAPGKKPAVIFVHGGPPRQMLLGWHYSDYYSNEYAENQELANRGFVVLSVNYRLGIGYGHDFHHASGAGRRGHFAGSADHAPAIRVPIGSFRRARRSGRCRDRPRDRQNGFRRSMRGSR